MSRDSPLSELRKRHQALSETIEEEQRRPSVMTSTSSNSSSRNCT